MDPYMSWRLGRPPWRLRRDKTPQNPMITLGHGAWGAKYLTLGFPSIWWLLGHPPWRLGCHPWNSWPHGRLCCTHGPMFENCPKPSLFDPKLSPTAKSTWGFIKMTFLTLKSHLEFLKQVRLSLVHHYPLVRTLPHKFPNQHHNFLLPPLINSITNSHIRFKMN